MEGKKLYKVAFCGKMSSGKSTAVGMLTGLLQNKMGKGNSAGLLMKFAGPIYDSFQALHIRAEDKPRVFMQEYGDLCRKEFGDDVFEKAFEKRLEHIVNNELPNRTYQHVLLLCDDVRFAGEAALLKKLGYTLVKINADESIRSQRNLNTFQNTGHRSETELDNIICDLEIDNNGTIYDFQDRMTKLLNSILPEEKRIIIPLGGQ
jgi:dephospho-CoA kinase